MANGIRDVRFYDALGRTIGIARQELHGKKSKGEGAASHFSWGPEAEDENDEAAFRDDNNPLLGGGGWSGISVGVFSGNQFLYTEVESDEHKKSKWGNSPWKKHKNKTNKALKDAIKAMKHQLLFCKKSLLFVFPPEI